MLGVQELARGKGRKHQPVVISRLALDYRLATSGPISCDIGQVRRIRQINKTLGVKPLGEIKLRGSPLAVLIDSGKIKGEELTAAQDIELAFFAISSRLMIKPMSHERVDGGGQSEEWPAKTAKAVARYQSWAQHWSDRAKRGDKTLSIVIAAIVDQRSFHTIEADAGVRHGKGPVVLARALRDYAARAGWVDGGDAAQWKAEASVSFPLRKRAAA